MKRVLDRGKESKAKAPDLCGYCGALKMGAFRKKDGKFPPEPFESDDRNMPVTSGTGRACEMFDPGTAGDDNARQEVAGYPANAISLFSFVLEDEP